MTPSARRYRAAPAPRGPRPAPRRSAFTLAEIVVALTLLSSGALVLVVASAAAVRVVVEGDAEMLAATIARNRLELLAGGTCGRLQDSTAFDSSSGARESWRVSRGRNGTRLLTDSVEYAGPSGPPRTVVLQRLVLC